MTGEKIMVVDDNKDFLEEIQETLFLCGYQAQGISESPGVLNTARRLRPDVILLDLRMGKMSGFDVAKQLKGSSDTAGIPIIGMSGYFPLNRRHALLEKGNMDGCIQKPFSILDLLTQIEQVLTKRTEIAKKENGV
ncbi:MAG: response regulator [Candidatus Omnitrophica bacterium]|nr:response regulator [Candidatus Omnitrophota bacterium]